MSPALFLRVRLWTLLLLAAIGLQAASPIRAPLDRMQGSAFSAATVDVALAGNRKAENAASAVQVMPPLPARAVLVHAPALPAFALTAPYRLRPEARGPPPREHPARAPDSTAPPLA
ncbi:hypothetical protein WSK_0687 [Novosphingobium sp. Rr 2-17]|uniref:hypothetical protein n=1 Tax=Novosphingobium sp. Rr 2-17 TaxID=555793 RepID=UPI0002697B02|nr:hypothetical protein [Novosphingobium sp. Rr 2-17]EIZ80714.1 hypothetical protein WSK_0687 [Novosphingobium sp. Rr 2-17]